MPPVWERDAIIYMDFRWKGRRYRPSTGMEVTEANRRLADQWDGAIHREITLGIFRMQNHFPSYRPAGYHRVNGDAFKGAATAWLESHKNSWAAWTYRKFKTDLESRVFPKIGHMKIADLTGKDLRLLREAIIGEGKLDGGKLSNRSVNRIMQPVKAIFNELLADGDIQINPAARLGKLKEKRIAEIDPFADDEVRAILKAIDPWYQPCVEFGFEFGGRLEDIFGVKWAKHCRFGKLARWDKTRRQRRKRRSTIAILLRVCRGRLQTKKQSPISQVGMCSLPRPASRLTGITFAD
jgi:integrase